MKRMNELHLLVQERCHRVPLYDTIEELKNPTGILAEEYSRIWKEAEIFLNQYNERLNIKNINCNKE